MKLITLNTWGAYIRGPLLRFIDKNQDIDVFCLQEVYENAREKLYKRHPFASHDLFSDLQKILPNHQAFFRPALFGVYGLAIFVKKDTSVLKEGEVSIHKDVEYFEQTGHHSRNLQWIKIGIGEKHLTVVNVHGLWNGMGKTDTPDRIAQSEKIRDFLRSVSGPKILCGDFNLRPDTESLKIAADGMRNLVEEYAIQSTRTSHYTKPEKFADYVFASPEIKVNDFRVLPDEVSDHAPLFLDFSVE